MWLWLFFCIQSWPVYIQSARKSPDTLAQTVTSGSRSRMPHICPEAFRALELSYNCSFYMCLFKWHDHVHSCSAWQGLFKRLWAVNTHAGVFRPPQSISDDSVSGSVVGTVVGTAALYLCILCFGWVSYLASVHLTSPMGTCPAT